MVVEVVSDTERKDDARVPADIVVGDEVL